MEQKTILITGATSGIGRAIALAFAKEWHVILLGRQLKILKQVSAEIERSGGTCSLYSVDLSLPKSITSVAQEILQHHPRIDWIVNNAGTIESKGEALDLSLEEFSHTLQVNLLAPYHLVQTLWQNLQKGEGGVVNISSTAGLRGNPDFLAYSASKAGLINLSEAFERSRLFQENDKYVINLIPGATNTPMRDRIVGDAAQQQSAQAITDWLLQTLPDINELRRIQGKRVIIKNGQLTLE